MLLPSPVRRAARRRLAWAALIALVALAAVAVPLPLFGGSKLGAALRTAAHTGVFALAAVAWMWLRGGGRQRPAWQIAAAALAFAAGAEVLESLLSGTVVSRHDMANNLLGVVLGLAVWRLLRARVVPTGPGTTASLLLVAVTCALLAAAPAVIALEAWVDQKRRFPVLFDAAFSQALALTESLGELDEVSIEIRDQTVSITLLSGPIPGLVVWHFQPDWRGFDRLVIDVENPTAVVLPLKIHVRDRDSSHHEWDHFNTAATLAPGARQRLSYPLADIQAAPENRSANLASMSIVAIYRAAGDANRFLLHAVALE